MKVGIISVFTDYHRRGAHHRGVLQPQAGPLIAAYLPAEVEVDIVNDAWEDPDWNRDYDLLFLSCLHSDFDRARQISHYWRRRGAKTVLGGTMASTYTELCAPYFDAIAVGDPESIVPRIVEDFGRGELKPVYVAHAFDARLVRPPRLDLMAGKQILPLAVEATRGCPFTCEFCALTGIGTRYVTRCASSVAAEIAAGQSSLVHRVPWWLRHIAIFYDNNLGGNPSHLRELCEAFAPRNIRWGACVSFNVISDRRNLEALAKGGCRSAFVGLETFNPDTLRHMGKHQNVLARTRKAVAACHDHGILVMAGLMLSPTTDSIEYIDSIPQYLAEVGLHVPTYVCFETPFPGTPHFKKLAASGDRAFLPNTLLRDLNGYTLAVPPRRASEHDFVEAYKRLSRTVYSRGARLKKFLHDVPRFAPAGHMVPLLFDLYELFSESAALNEGRNFLAGLDIEPPEARAVPLSEADFKSEGEFERIVNPWRISDERGRTLPMWDGARATYAHRRCSDARGSADHATSPSAPDDRIPAESLGVALGSAPRRGAGVLPFPRVTTHRDPLFALRRSARNLQNSARLLLFPELDGRLPRQEKALYVVFVHGGLSCCFDTFGDLFPRIEATWPADRAPDRVRLLRFEHDTYQAVNTNAERLCALISDKLAPHSAAGQMAELIFVAHSRGGLVARVASDRLIERQLWNPDRMEVFTFGSPHQGTPFFESEVTWAVDYLIRGSGRIGFGLLRLVHGTLREGIAKEIRRHLVARRRRRALLGNTAGSSVLDHGRLALNFVLGRAAATRCDGPRILRWPPGIEDVRESSAFIRGLPPVPRCSRFWTFGSTYDVRVNRQNLDPVSRRVLAMVQRAFVAGAAASTKRFAPPPRERNDLVVSMQSATAVGIACPVNDNLWHCGYFRAAPGEGLAQYLHEKVRAGENAGTGQTSERPHYVDPAFVVRVPPATDSAASPAVPQQPRSSQATEWERQVLRHSKKTARK